MSLFSEGVVRTFTNYSQLLLRIKDKIWSYSYARHENIEWVEV